MGTRPSASASSPAVEAADLPPEPVEDDAADIAPGDRVLLVALPDAELLMVAEAGHMVMMERPEVVNEALERFIAHALSQRV